MARCRGPVNRLIMLRKKGISGPFFQNTGSVCVKGMGNAFDAGGPLNSFAAQRLQCETDPSGFCVIFNREIEPTSSPTLGVSVTVNAAGSAFNASISGNQICYTFVDPDLLVEGDEIIWAYDGPIADGGSGNIRDTSDEPEYAAAKTLTCSIPYSSTRFQTGWTAGVLCEAA